MVASAAALLCCTPAWAQAIALPQPGAQYDSQLGGAYPPPAGTAIVSRDRTEPAAEGLYSICYVNAFQTQPHESDWWLASHPELLLWRKGVPVHDPAWPDEILLDTTTEDSRQALARIIGGWIEGCALAGYQAIEADNLDTFSRSAGAIHMDDNLALAAILVERSHALGLAFAQKNAGELGSMGKAIGFDFAIVEGCQVYEECQTYTDVFGDRVIEIEYSDTDSAHFTQACLARGGKISVIRRDRNLSMPSEASYLYQTC